MKMFELDRKSLLHPAEEMRQFVEYLIKRNGPYVGMNKRTEARVPVALPVVAVQVDNALNPMGEAFGAITRDISSKGIAILHNTAIDARLLAIELTDPDERKLQAVFEVLRHHPIGNYFQTAGTFVTKIYDAPLAKPTGDSG